MTDPATLSLRPSQALANPRRTTLNVVDADVLPQPSSSGADDDGEPRRG